jgi:hypothetical protein
MGGIGMWAYAFVFGVVGFIGFVLLGKVAEKGALGRRTNTDVYPTAVRSTALLKSLMEGVVLRPVEGVSRILRKEPPEVVRRIEVTEGRRPREVVVMVIEGLRPRT